MLIIYSIQKYNKIHEPTSSLFTHLVTIAIGNVKTKIFKKSNKATET